MRELKFRVWKEETKEWVLLFDKIIGWDQPLLSEDYTATEYFVVEQFTGAKDMNGRDIYEGDLVEFHSYEDWGDTVGYKLVMQVFYNEAQASFRMATPHAVRTGYGNGQNLTDLCRIVGNIHENKELL